MIFDRVALDHAIRSSMPKESSITTGRVHYDDVPRVFKLSLERHPFMIDYDRVIAAGLQQAVLEHTLRHHDIQFFQKSSDWQSEKEYRWLMWDNVHNDHFFEFGDSLKGVGSSFDPTSGTSFRAVVLATKYSYVS